MSAGQFPLYKKSIPKNFLHSLMTHMNSLKNCAVYTRAGQGDHTRSGQGGTTDTLALVLLLSDGQRFL